MNGNMRILRTKNLRIVFVNEKIDDLRKYMTENLRIHMNEHLGIGFNMKESCEYIWLEI